MYSDYQVILNFSDGTNNYDLPFIQNIIDPIPGIKANIIRGIRSDGAIVIPGGKRAIEIEVKGKLWTNDGYKALMLLRDEMQTKVTTLPATLTLKYFDPTLSGGGAFINNWSYSVRRIDDISFSSPDMRTISLDYQIKFLVVAY